MALPLLIHTASAEERTTQLAPSPDFQYRLQAALIDAVPGDTINLQAGRYELKTELNIASSHLTIRGAGPDKTILSFKNQNAGSNGIVSTGDAFVIEDLAIEDTVGNAIKTLGATDVTFRRVRVQWTGDPSSSNGAYGIYPVECRNVLIEECWSIGASDAGIYVGQSQDVIVKNCLAERNVAGIEIENTLRADVYGNIARNNAAGILVFDLPGLTLTNGGQVRVFQNRCNDNNHPNFAPKGTMVSDVPAGTGMMVMATDNVEIFENDIHNNETSNVVVVSFLVTERKINDAKYDPYPESISIHDNRISNGGTKPKGQLGILLSPLMAGRFPDIFYDGIINTDQQVDGKLPEKLQLGIRDNGDATFANANLADFSPTNVFSGKYVINRNIADYDAKHDSLPAATVKAHSKPSDTISAAVAEYRSAPQQLSEWKLFTQTNHRWQPAEDLLVYELNTPLFSDDTIKRRMIRLPAGASISWNNETALNFPVGTVIAKTFAYPDFLQDMTPEERFLETRVEYLTSDGWFGYSYVWNEDQTDATLSLGGAVISASWTDKSGVDHTNEYQVPNANQCLSCHEQNGRYEPLGPTARNLNRQAIGDSRSQLESWISTGFLKDAPKDHPQLPVYNDDATGDLNARARAWLEVNCAHCHNPAGSARTSGLDLRTVQNDPGKFGVMKSPVATGKGSGGRRYDIVPGKPEDSILMFRIETDEPGARMPNLARNLNHPESAELIRKWIAAMKPETSN